MNLSYDYYYLSKHADVEYPKWAKDERYNYCEGRSGFSIFHHIYWNLLGK